MIMLETTKMSTGVITSQPHSLNMYVNSSTAGV